MRPPIVLVEWEDACNLDNSVTWVEKTEHVYKPVIIQTVGFLLSSTKLGVIVSGAWQEDATGPRDQIPRGMIRKVTKLRP